MKIPGYLLYCLLMLTQYSFAAETPGIYHIPPKTLTQNSYAEITCVVSVGDCHLKTVKIFLRSDPSALYKEFAMQYHDGLWILPLIPEMVQGDSLYYFITAEFDDFAAVAFPTEKPADDPVKVKLVRPKTKLK